MDEAKVLLSITIQTDYGNTEQDIRDVIEDYFNQANESVNESKVFVDSVEVQNIVPCDEEG